MKKNILILALLCCSSVFAQFYEVQSPKDKVIYCPTKIICANNTCTFDSEDAKYFGKMSIVSNDGSPLSASYPYQSTLARFHSHNTYAVCQYGKLNLEIKTASNLEAYRLEGSSWRENNEAETCYGNCPLHEGMGFVIINSIHPGGVYASIVQQDISKLITENFRIIFDDTLLKCGGLKECIIDLQSDQRKKYGYIVVDMDTMKILQVNSIDPAIKIKKIDGLNAVEINKIDGEKEEEAIYCPPVIKCQNAVCTFASVDAKYFGEINFSVPITSSDQLFQFDSAHYDGNSLKATCYYSNHGSINATLLTNPEYHLENYSNKANSLWVPGGKYYNCKTSTEKCPLKNRFDIVIHNININNGLYASIANIYTSQLLFSNGLISINHHDAEPECGEKKECTINLLSSQQAQYGSVTIDMKTMRILRVNSLYPNYIKINKVSNMLSDMAEVSYVTALKFIPKNLR